MVANTQAHADPDPPPQLNSQPNTAPQAPSEAQVDQTGRTARPDGSSTDLQAPSERQANETTAPPDGSSTANAPGQSRPRKTVFVGRASYYAYRGGRTASGQSFNAQALTAAHRTLPFGTLVRVTDLKTSKSVEVVITDRGPALRSRVLDLSYGAAKALGIGSRGVIQVRAEVISG